MVEWVSLKYVVEGKIQESVLREVFLVRGLISFSKLFMKMNEIEMLKKNVFSIEWCYSSSFGFEETDIPRRASSRFFFLSATTCNEIFQG